ncbi:hypothetical protein FPCIR_3021 [Fusarium pseudocircinatum]|uniref:Uncharacterized protein n=1 Tax=Fusarium pseudocircinatum TaxID=56676 RepID=A0A8H5UUA1_9HYPO|nr:hypothetical protein FPCIR_3021 [Fusarium pseudocircinatum]
MSDIPRINSSSKRKNSQGHEVMQNREASSLDILETTENTDDVSGAANNNGNSNDNESPPTKKKRTDEPHKPNKGQPRETPCQRCISRMADKGPKHFCCYQASTRAIKCYACACMHRSCRLPVGRAAELGKQLQNFARRLVNSQGAGESATQVKWRKRARAAKASLTAIQEMPSVFPNQESQSVLKEFEPDPSSNLPPLDDIQHFSAIPTHSIQSGQHFTASPQGMSVPESFAAPEYPPVSQDILEDIFQDIPADDFMAPQGNPSQGFSHQSPGPSANQPQCPIHRFESTLNRVAAGIEENNRLMQQILARADQNINAPINFNL